MWRASCPAAAARTGKEEDTVRAACEKQYAHVGNERDKHEFMRGRQIASGHGVLYLTSEKHRIHHFLFWLTKYKICWRVYFFPKF
jgi:hypothetical protein